MLFFYSIQGKTLLLKEGAIRLSERKQEREEKDEQPEEPEEPEPTTLQQNTEDILSLDTNQDKNKVEPIESGILRSKNNAGVMEDAKSQDGDKHSRFGSLRLKASSVRNRMSTIFKDRQRKDDREEEIASEESNRNFLTNIRAMNFKRCIKMHGKPKIVTEEIEKMEEWKMEKKKVENMDRRDSFFLTDIGVERFEECDNKCNNPRIYYISLVATNPETGFPEKENYLFDVASELELQGCGVTFMSTQDLQWVKQEKRGNKLVPSKIYGLVLSFIQANPGSSFFLDEIPMLQKKDNFGIGKNALIGFYM